jgi:hypothetical protein
MVGVAIIDTPAMKITISFRTASSFRSGLASPAWNIRSRKANLFSKNIFVFFFVFLILI